MKHKWSKKTGALLAAFALAGLLVFPAAAEDGIDYVLDTDGMTHVPIPLCYQVSGIIRPSSADFGALKGAKDMVLAQSGMEKAGCLFVADTGNNRVVRITPEGAIDLAITEADGVAFSGPAGIALDKDGDLYISDAGNQRIVHTTADGAYVETFHKPESEMLGDDVIFDISRLSVTETGMLYVMKGQNFMMMDAGNQFKGYISANRVPFNLEFLIMRLFATKRQMASYIKPKPAVYGSFDMDRDGFLYATSESAGNQIQIVNASGENVYVSKFFGEHTFDAGGALVNPSFTDIAAGPSGIISVVEKNSARIYQYDRQGNLLTVFGGKGSVKGFFETPSALLSDEQDRLYVLDGSRNEITVFAPTSFMRNIISALALYQSGDYEAAYDKWAQVYEVDAGYPLANDGMALTMYKEGRNGEAMAYYKKADNKSGYSQAFDDLRYQVFRSRFIWIALGVLAGAAGLFVGVMYMKKASEKLLAGYYRRKGEANSARKRGGRQ